MQTAVPAGSVPQAEDSAKLDGRESVNALAFDPLLVLRLMTRFPMCTLLPDFGVALGFA